MFVLPVSPFRRDSVIRTVELEDLLRDPVLKIRVETRLSQPVVTHGSIRNNPLQFSSIHQRNLYLASRPVIIIFEVAGVALYQVFALLRVFLLLVWRPLSSFWRNRKEKWRANSDPQVITMSGYSHSQNVPMSFKGGPGLTDPLIARQKHHHRKAFELISRALRIDEAHTGNKDEAISLYKRGIAELEKGIAIECNGLGDQWERAQRIQEKMIVNLAMAKERLEYLNGSEEDEVQELFITRNSGQLLPRFSPPRSQNVPDIINEDSGSNSNSRITTGINMIKNGISRLGYGSTSQEVPKPDTVVKPQTSRQSGFLGAKRVVNTRPPVPGNSPAATNSGISRISGRKLEVPAKTSVARGSSNTLPRNMGSKNATNVLGAGRGKTSTPPVTKKLGGTVGVVPKRVPASTKTASNAQETKKLTHSIRSCDAKLAQLILDEVIEGGTLVSWDDISGQEAAKQALEEIVILPSLRPELFTGLRAPARGLLLFGPPGNGKTMLAKAVANESNSKFFNISASSLTSKYVGEGEKLVRALFSVARELQPAIIFVDEIDSLLCERKESEHEASRRLKTEFLVEFDGLHSQADERILVMGATNRPQELDDAALRRFPKRIYVCLPEQATRVTLLRKLLSSHGNPLSERELNELAKLTDGYSGSDLTALAKDAALGPIRGLNPSEVKSLDLSKMRSITLQDFKDSLRKVRPSVSPPSLNALEKWNRTYGDVSVFSQYQLSQIFITSAASDNSVPCKGFPTYYTPTFRTHSRSVCFDSDLHVTPSFKPHPPPSLQAELHIPMGHIQVKN
ncbi:unnamed protein product [Allacma fusca]|uniref:Spastin n=1 Tax=Allacma fusca TaxID=39272 RepID=A0A8J2JDD6_9HEXA|nr:unnamed protein product [Allacma fusca]